VIEARGVSARLGSFHLHDITFSLPRGEYGVVIGPAGSGKTTLLETIAGVIPQTSGELLLNGANMAHAPARTRQIGLVYQHGYLFPHLTVRGNIRYGVPASDGADEVIDRLGARDLLDRDVRGLSGGERQLVALARALAPRPPILLLDEPFSALDPRRRTQVRRELRNIHREWGTTVLQVTHDFAEAGMLGNLAILLSEGRVLQHGSPEEVFRKPKSPYIAEFLGAENVLTGEVIIRDTGDVTPASRNLNVVEESACEFRSGSLTLAAVAATSPGPACAVIRGEEIVVSHEPMTSSMRNSFRGTIAECATLGALTRVTIDIDGTQLVASLTTRSAQEMKLREGQTVYAAFKAMAVHIC
jgi:molybdopterin-binding protein